MGIFQTKWHSQPEDVWIKPLRPCYWFKAAWLLEWNLGDLGVENLEKLKLLVKENFGYNYGTWSSSLALSIWMAGGGVSQENGLGERRIRLQHRKRILFHVHDFQGYSHEPDGNWPWSEWLISIWKTVIRLTDVSGKVVKDIHRLRSYAETSSIKSPGEYTFCLDGP